MDQINLQNTLVSQQIELIEQQDKLLSENLLKSINKKNDFQKETTGPSVDTNKDHIDATIRENDEQQHYEIFEDETLLITINFVTVEKLRNDGFNNADVSGLGATRFLCGLLIALHGTLELSLRYLPDKVGHYCETFTNSQKILVDNGVPALAGAYKKNVLLGCAALTEFFYPNYVFQIMLQVGWVRDLIHKLSTCRQIVLSAYIQHLTRQNKDIGAELVKILDESYRPDGFDFPNAYFN